MEWWEEVVEWRAFFSWSWSGAGVINLRVEIELEGTNSTTDYSTPTFLPSHSYIFR